MYKYYLIVMILLFICSVFSFEVTKISEFGISNDYYNPFNGIVMSDKTIILGNRGIDIYDTSEDLLEKIGELSCNGVTFSYAVNDNLIFWKSHNKIFKTNYTILEDMTILDAIEIQSGTKLFLCDDHLYFSHLQNGGTFKIDKYDFDLNFITNIEYEENRCSMFRTPDGVFYNYGDNDDDEFLYFYDFQDDVFSKTDSILIDYEMSEPSFSAFLNDSLFAVTSGLSGLRIYDLNQPNQSNVVAEFPPPINSCIEYSNQLITMCDDKLELYDISDLNNILLLDTYQANDLFLDINNRNDRFIVDTYNGNVLLFKIENDEFILLDSNPDSGLSKAMHYQDECLYTYTCGDGVTKWNLSDIGNPVKIYTENLCNAFSINFYDNELLCRRRIYSGEESYVNTEKYTLNEEGLSFPEIIPFQNSFKKHENYYYGFINGAVHKYSYSNNQFIPIDSLQIDLIGNYPTMFFHVNLLICSSYDAMIVIKLNDDEPMENIAEIDLNGLGGRSFSSYYDYLFVSDRYHDFITLIYDLSDLDNIRFVGEIEQSGVLEIDEENDLLFMGYFDCYVYDISDIESGLMPEVGFIPGFSSSKELDAIQNRDNNYLINLEETGCTIYEYNPIVSSDENIIEFVRAKLINYPNPFNPSTVICFTIQNDEIMDETRIELFNVKGQKIMEFPNSKVSFLGNNSSGHQVGKVTWDGTDYSGKQVASGVYFVTLKAGDKAIDSRKMLLLK